MGELRGHAGRHREKLGGRGTAGIVASAEAVHPGDVPTADAANWDVIDDISSPFPVPFRPPWPSGEEQCTSSSSYSAYSSSAPYSSSHQSHTISPYPTLPTFPRRNSVQPKTSPTKTPLNIKSPNASPGLFTRPGSQKLFQRNGKLFLKDVVI